LLPNIVKKKWKFNINKASKKYNLIFYLINEFKIVEDSKKMAEKI
jgi:hypothetical protein